MNILLILAAVGGGVPIVPVLIGLVLLAVGMWALNTYVPMSAGWKKLINIVVAVIVVLWLLNVFGVWSYLNTIHT